MSVAKLKEDSKFRQKFYKNIEPNQAVGISESIIFMLFHTCTHSMLPSDYWISLSQNISLRLYLDEGIFCAKLFLVEKGVIDLESNFWSWMEGE
jgi:hypothetical protein